MRKKILAVDDDRSLLTYLSFHLEEYGHEVLTAEDGISALNILTSFEPDIIFVDLILPKIDGENLCRVIRTMNHLNEAYLVVMSSALSEFDLDYASMGADACIAKSHLPDMIEHVHDIIRESEQPREDGDILMRGPDTVSPRKSTQELIQQKRHLEAILESLDIGVLEIFLGRVIFLNRGASLIIGKPKEEILNTYPPELFHAEVRDRVEKLLQTERGSIPSRLNPSPIDHGGRLLSVQCRRLDPEASTLLIFRDVTREYEYG